MSSHAITLGLENMTATKETLSSRLLCALNRLKISQSELARLIGVKPQVIQYLCTSNANKSKFSFEIATAIGVNPSWLIGGKGPMLDLSSPNPNLVSQPMAPLLTWDNIFSWLNKNPGEEIQTEFVAVTNMPTSTSYALRITDASMIPRFEIGTVLIIDPNLKPSNNDFVIAKISYQQQPVIRQLIRKADQYFLSPMNTAMYKEIELKNEDKILGVVKQTYFEFTR